MKTCPHCGAVDTSNIESEIEYLAKYIMENVPGEPSQSEGAGHCAARIIGALQSNVTEQGVEIRRLWLVEKTLTSDVHHWMRVVDSLKAEISDIVGENLEPEEIIGILQQEIVWCLDHPDPELNNDQQMGFMNGLRQAQYLIRSAQSEKDTWESLGQGISEHEPDYSEGGWK